MVHPDLAKTLEMLDQARSSRRCGCGRARRRRSCMWAQQFKGEAINLSSLLDADATRAGACPTARS